MNRKDRRVCPTVAGDSRAQGVHHRVVGHGQVGIPLPSQTIIL